MSVELWQQCIDLLRDELPAQQFNTWIRPLQVEAEGDELRVYAPNRFVLDWVNEKYLSRLLELLSERATGLAPSLSLLIGSKRTAAAPQPLASATRNQQPVGAPAAAAPPQAGPAEAPVMAAVEASPTVAPARAERNVQVEGGLKHTSYLNRTLTF